MASDVTTRCSWPGRGESVTELMPFMNFLVNSYTCCNDRHASPYRTFIRRLISLGFAPSLLKKRMTEHCSTSMHVASEAAIFTLLLCRCVAFLHRTVTCRPLFKPSVSLLSTYRQSTSVSNFYRTFKVFIWLSLVVSHFSFSLSCFSLKNCIRYAVSVLRRTKRATAAFLLPAMVVLPVLSIVSVSCLCYYRYEYKTGITGNAGKNALDFINTCNSSEQWLNNYRVKPKPTSNSYNVISRLKCQDYMHCASWKTKA